MDKKLAGILGAAAALATLNGASAGTVPATTYRELLETVPNAMEALKADDARLAASETTDRVQVAQWHHHHNRWWRHHHHNSWWRHHHHHHHNSWWRRHHHHHHHHY